MKSLVLASALAVSLCFSTAMAGEPAQFHALSSLNITAMTDYQLDAVYGGVEVNTCTNGSCNVNVVTQTNICAIAICNDLKNESVIKNNTFKKVVVKRPPPKTY